MLQTLKRTSSAAFKNQKDKIGITQSLKRKYQ
jgi:hypothetical protein